jgi:hypothetical protein
MGKNIVHHDKEGTEMFPEKAFSKDELEELRAQLQAAKPSLPGPEHSKICYNQE